MLVVQGYPGQPSNPVGYAAGPNYPGSLTSKASGTFTSNTTYNNLLVDGGTSAPSINATNCVFNNCYFGASTDVSGGHPCMTYPNGGPHTFNYCTFGPSPSVVGGSFPPMPPGGGGYLNWPTDNNFTYDSVPGAVSHGIDPVLGNDYGPAGSGASTPATGGLFFYHCDMWALCNGVVFSNITAPNPLVFDNCWLHDPTASPDGAHTDGIGDVQGQVNDTLEHITINHCTIAVVANSNALAFQNDNSCIMNNLTITNNFWTSTCSYLLYPGADSLTNPVTNYVFANNVISIFLPPQYGLVHGPDNTTFSIPASGNKWRNNLIYPGNYNGEVGLITKINYLWPDGTGNTTDWAGAY